MSGRPIISSPTPSDPSSSPFHLDRNDSEFDVNTLEQGPSEQSHTISYEHGYSSRSNTRPSSADKSPDSDSSSIETPARPSEDHQAHQMAVEVVDESGQLIQPLPHADNQSRQNPIYRDVRGNNGPAADHLALAPRNQDKVSVLDRRSPVARPGSGPFSLETRNSEDNPGSGLSPARQEAIPTQMVADGPHTDAPSGEEPYSPASEYTKEGGLASEDSHIQRTSTVSDGGFGIGLSLLQGLANGDRDSRNWSESETDIESSFPKPPTQTQPRLVQPLSPPGDLRVSTASNGPAAAVPGRKYSGVSESDGVDNGFQWDDDDLLDDYRYSRYSLSSKTSKQSRSSTVPSVTRTYDAAPPLPEDGRPSLDGQSSTRSTSSPQPYTRTSLLVPAPLNIVKNSSREATPSPTTPVPYGNHSYDDVKATPTRAAFGRQDSTDDDEPAGTTDALRLPGSQDLTPKPSNETLTLRTDALERIAPSTSNDYNGDESASEHDDSQSEEAEEEEAVMSPDPLSPSSAAGSTSSIFLPHPGAPKPIVDHKGQIAPRTAAIHIATSRASMHAEHHDDSVPSPEASQQLRSPVILSIPAAVSLISMLAMAAERARKVKQTTVYGTTQTDLLSSSGPVPIAFSLEGHPPSPRAMHESDFGFPRRSPTPKSASPVGFPSNGADGKTSPAQVQPIPRANFFPSNGRPRPRSRSFSGFSINDAEVLIPSVTT